jgi:phosphatidylserine/phosphatidylglycerophosphate/cardiolipin synthase-like enzyme
MFPHTISPRLSALLLPALLVACAAEAPPLPEGFDPSRDPQSCSGKCDGAAGVTPLAALPTASLATLFSPSEPALGLDLSLIEDVRAARAADSQVYPEGENPFSIRYAVYNLRNPEIVSALADAADEGVDVQILIEQDQLDPARTWNTTDEFLIDRGFEFVENNNDLNAATRKTADLIGISGSGLMHLKSRIYRWNDASTGAPEVRLTTGSMNPGDLAVNNEETLHYIDDASLIASFEAKYDAVRDNHQVTNTWTDGAALQVLFSPDGGEQAIDHIAELIDSEDEMILIAMYSMRNIKPKAGGKGIVERLVDAHERGVKVVVILDRKQSDGVDSSGNGQFFNDGFEDDLRDGGVPVFEVINPSSQFNAMHTKYGVFGITNPIVVTDAGNWTRAGLGNGSSKPKNDETVLFIDSNALDGGITGARYRANFVSILRRYASAPNASLFQSGGADFRTTIEELLAEPGWPQVSVEVNAIAETFFGQGVFLTGESDQLGQWTQQHFGVKLDTSASTYPSWSSDNFEMPLGSRVEAKLIKMHNGSTHWEQGGNRVLDADPTSFKNRGVDPHATLLPLEMSFRN